MKVIDVLKDTCTFLQLEDEIEYLNYYNDSTNTFDVDESIDYSSAIKNVELLTKCFNLVLNTICTEYVKLKDSTIVSSTNSRIPYSSLTTNNICDILSVENEEGKPVVFADFGGEIVLSSNGKYKVTYSYSLSDFDIGDSVTEISYPAKTIAYGVASEYLYISKLYDDASVWDTRFKNSLLNLLSTKKQLYIKPRRWF